MIWFTADEHYGHENARLGWGKPEQARPFESLEEMTETLITNHNAVVSAGDWVYHLGDMFWRTLTTKQCIDTVKRLKGQHVYILGNHEEAMQHECGVRAMFCGVRDRFELHISNGLSARSATEPTPKMGKLHIVLDHYAGRVWNGCHRGSWQLHGHSHGMLPDIGLRQMDVGVDCHGFTPVSLEQVKKFMEAR